MAKKFNNKGDDDDYDAWGMGQKFVIVKFLNPLKEFTYAAKQARYGIVEGDSFLNHPSYRTQNRLDGLDRMYFIMITLSYDVFSFLDKAGKKKMLRLRNRIQIVKKLLKHVTESQHNHVNHTNEMTIKEDLFDTCFETLLDINTHMIEVMNQTGFIFRLRDDVNMDDYMDDVIHGG